MLNSNFFKLLSTLTKKEVLSFHQFALGVNAQKKVPNRLLNYVVSCGTDKTVWKNISIEEAYAATFNQSYSSDKHRKKIFNTLAELDVWLTDYLIWKEVKQTFFIRQFILATIYQKRGLIDRFNKAIKQSVKFIKTIPNNFWKPFQLMLFYHLSYFYSSGIDLHKSSKLNLAIECLEQFYLQAKLKYVGEMVNRKNVLNDNKDFLIPTELLHSVGKGKYQDNQYMQLYYWLIQLSKNRTEDAYKKVKYYFNLVTFTDKEEENEILVHQLNFCTYAIRLGNRSYIQENLYIYKEALEANRLNLTGPLFLNIVSFSCFAKDTDWADYFLDRYRSKMGRLEEKDFVFLSEARIFIERKQYEEALSSLLNIQSKFFQIESKRRIFQIKCLVELDENPVITLNHCDNFLLYLKREKFSSQEIKLSHINFIKVVQKLQRNISMKEINAFVEKETRMSFRNWVLEWIEK